MDTPLEFTITAPALSSLVLAGLLATGCGSAPAPPSGGPEAQGPNTSTTKSLERPAPTPSFLPESPAEPMSPPAAAAPAAQDSARRKPPPEKVPAGKERGAGIGAATSTGGHVNDMAKVVAGMAPAFTRCYDIGLGQDSKMAGSVRVTIKIGPKGEVISAAPAGGDGLSAEVIACVIHVVQAARFSPPEGGSATITIPLTMG
jgi:hypothetical protein